MPDGTYRLVLLPFDNPRSFCKLHSAEVMNQCDKDGHLPKPLKGMLKI